MQEPNLVEMPSSVGVSNWPFLKHLSAETCTLSLPDTTEEADSYHLSQNRKLGGLFELDMVQENLSREEGDWGNDEASPDSVPDAFTAEAGSTWGDFEGFSEVKSENENHIPESLENLNGEQTSTQSTDVNDNHCTTSCGQISFRTAGQNRRDVFPNVPMKATLSSEDVIKLSFPEVPVPQLLQNISSLNQMLDTNTEDVGVPERTKMQPCTGSGNLWKLLTRSRNPSGLRCPWNESHCQENLLAVLGIDAHQKISMATYLNLVFDEENCVSQKLMLHKKLVVFKVLLDSAILQQQTNLATTLDLIEAISESEEDVLEKSSVKEMEDSNIDNFSISNCKALIQTKLSVSPDPRQSHLFTYNLFLKKTPSTGNMQYITVPQKKRIFTTQSLKMKMFSSNVC